MKQWEPKSERIDAFEANGIRLTLATWQSEPYYSPSYEIGFRRGEHFTLIQWSGIHSQKAWDIAKRMATKNKSADKIQKIFDRIGW
jgi:hypothetical protein